MSRARLRYLTVRARPRWLRTLVADEAKSVQARAAGGGLWLRIIDAQRRRTVFVIHAAADTGVTVSRVVRAGDEPVLSDAGVAPEHAGEIATFFDRMMWVGGLLNDAPQSNAYRPSTEERELARAYRRIRALKGPADVGDETEPLPLDLDLYVDLSRGRFRRLMNRADQPQPLEHWIEPAVLALSGDLAALRAAAGREARPDGLLAVFEGLAFQDARFDRRAYTTMRVDLASLEARERASHYLVLAELAAQFEGAELAVRLLEWTAAADADDHHLLRAVAALLRFGAFGSAWEALAKRARRTPPSFDVFIALAELALWCGRTERAAEWIERARALRPDAVETKRADAIRLALLGEDDRALAALLELEAQAHARVDGQVDVQVDAQVDAQVYCWIAELYGRRAETERASHYLELARARAQTACHTLLTAAATRKIVPGLDAALEAVGLQAVGTTSVDAAARAARTAIARFHGNRTALLTRTPDASPAEPHELVAVPIPPSDMLLVSRDASAELLKTIRTQHPDVLHEAFRELAETYPRSPHPWCYWGELRLWLGQLDEARACFEHEVARGARWAYVGRAAVHVHRGELDAALAEFSALSKAYAPVPGATTHVYLGELLWMRGDYDAALRELATATEVKPDRVSAHLLIALCLHAQGDLDEAGRVYEMLLARHPRLFWDAARSLSLPWPPPGQRLPELLEECLRMMRGNRSSHTMTYFDCNGAMRIVTDAAVIAASAANRAYLIERALLDRLTG